MCPSPGGTRQGGRRPGGAGIRYGGRMVWSVPLGLGGKTPINQGLRPLARLGRPSGTGRKGDGIDGARGGDVEGFGASVAPHLRATAARPLKSPGAGEITQPATDSRDHVPNAAKCRRDGAKADEGPAVKGYGLAGAGFGAPLPPRGFARWLNGCAPPGLWIWRFALGIERGASYGGGAVLFPGARHGATSFTGAGGAGRI